MKIECACGKYLGEIRDAKLRNGIVYQCAECAKQARQAAAYLRMQKAERVRLACGDPVRCAARRSDAAADVALRRRRSAECVYAGDGGDER